MLQFRAIGKTQVAWKWLPQVHVWLIFYVCAPLNVISKFVFLNNPQICLLLCLIGKNCTQKRPAHICTHSNLAENLQADSSYGTSKVCFSSLWSNSASYGFWPCKVIYFIGLCIHRHSVELSLVGVG